MPLYGFLLIDILNMLAGKSLENEITIPFITSLSNGVADRQLTTILDHIL